MNADNLLDCIAHGTTHKDFLATFDGPEEAAKHLREFYVNALKEAGADVPDDEDLDELEANTLAKLKRVR